MAPCGTGAKQAVLNQVGFPEVKDSAGPRVTLDEYKGKNVILAFYLGAECAHCMRQLHTLGEKKDEWERLNTVVLAVSKASPESNSAGVKAATYPSGCFRTTISPTPTASIPMTISRKWSCIPPS
jgi:thiol-disulfide isomerase/thioredoxin